MMQAEPGIPQSCSIFSDRAPQPPRPSRRWGAGTALVVLVAVLGIATPEDAQAAVPSEPRNFKISANDARAILQWSVPTDDGGKPITHYDYRYVEGDTEPDSTIIWTLQEEQTPNDDTDAIDAAIAAAAVAAIADVNNPMPGEVPTKLRSVEIRGLVTGTEYTFQVRAQNSQGTSAPATQVAMVIVKEVEGPEITLSWEDNVPDAGLELTFTVTITFSEAVTGFAPNDISVQGSYPNGGGARDESPVGRSISWPTEKANLQAISGTTYSVDVMTPTPQYVTRLGEVVRAESVFFLIKDEAVLTVDGGIPRTYKSLSRFT